MRRHATACAHASGPRSASLRLRGLSACCRRRRRRLLRLLPGAAAGAAGGPDHERHRVAQRAGRRVRVGSAALAPLPACLSPMQRTASCCSPPCQQPLRALTSAAMLAWQSLVQLPAQPAACVLLALCCAHSCAPVTPHCSLPAGMTRSLGNAFSLYLKTRPAASSESVRRAKGLGAEGGHPLLLAAVQREGHGLLDMQVMRGCVWRSHVWLFPLSVSLSHSLSDCLIGASYPACISASTEQHSTARAPTLLALPPSCLSRCLSAPAASHTFHATSRRSTRCRWQSSQRSCAPSGRWRRCWRRRLQRRVAVATCA